MALDAAFLQFIAAQLDQKLAGSFADKIYQPSKDEILISFHGAAKARLMISCSPNAARIHLTERAVQNPKVPPNFCMVLRKHLLNARLKKIVTPSFERVIMLTFDGKNDFFEPVEKTLLLEIMGRTSNIILIDDSRTIINAIRHVDVTMTRHRQILPGLPYELPPVQGKIDMITAADTDAWNMCPEKTVPQALMDTYAGISPIVAREISYRVLHSIDKHISEISTPQKEKITAEILSVKERITLGQWDGCIVRRKDTGKIIDFSFMPIGQYENFAVVEPFLTPSSLLEEVYTHAAILHRQKQKAAGLSEFLTRTAARIRRTKSVREKELADSKEADKYQLYGQLIHTNLHVLHRGDTLLTTQNFFSEKAEQIEIPLRPELSPVQNAARYFKKYSKAKNACKIIGELIEKDEKELSYLDSVFVALCDAENEEDIEQIRLELVSEHYLKAHSLAKGGKKPDISHPREFVSDDGYTILVGKNNLQNDYMTTHLSRKNDIWLHTKSIHGSHVLLLTHGTPLDDIPDLALLQAASLCAFYSKGKESGKVDVDYCPVQNVRKPSGARPGMVIYEHYFTVVVSPDGKLAERIRKK